MPYETVEALVAAVNQAVAELEWYQEEATRLSRAVAGEDPLFMFNYLGPSRSSAMENRRHGVLISLHSFRRNVSMFLDIFRDYKIEFEDPSYIWFDEDNRSVAEKVLAKNSLLARFVALQDRAILCL